LNIGLTQRVLYYKDRAYDSIEHGWYSYLKEHTLTFIPNRTDQDFDKLADSLDILIITGGDDNAIRRSVEIKIATAMLVRKKPILGVCHGNFLLTSILGGELGSIEDHMETIHPVYYFGDEHVVNSFHNVRIVKPHHEATVLVVDPHGNCEAWIDKTIAGITWHPERMDDPWIPDEIQDLLKI